MFLTPVFGAQHSNDTLFLIDQLYLPRGHCLEQCRFERFVTGTILLPRMATASQRVSAMNELCMSRVFIRERLLILYCLLFANGVNCHLKCLMLPSSDSLHRCPLPLSQSTRCHLTMTYTSCIHECRRFIVL
jgi:hypothetical protein